MKIGISTAFLHPEMGGVWTHTTNLIHYLPLVDPDNYYCLIDTKDKKLPLEGYARPFIYPLSGFKFSNFLWHNFVLPSKLFEHGFDLIHITTPTGQSLMRKPCLSVVNIHDITPILFPQTHGDTIVKHYRYVLPSILKRADAVITCSINTKLDLMKYLRMPEEKLFVASLGVSEKFRPVDKSEAKNYLQEKYQIKNPFLLFVGVLEPRKNVLGLIEAFSRVQKQIPDFKLVIAGSKGWKYEKIFSRVQKFNIEKDVIFMGFIPDQDLPFFYNAATVFIYPSLYEGFGLPPLEAMACGTPVITSNNSSLPEVVGDTAYLISPTDIEDLVQAIKEVVLNPEKQKELAEKGLKRSAEFTWKAAAEQTIKVYKTLAQRHELPFLNKKFKNMQPAQEKPDLSVVVVNWNTSALLKDCLKSLFQSSPGLNLEVLVADNASTDDSVKMIREEFPQVLLKVNEQNLGFAGANNLLLPRCRGKFIMLLNPDTYIPPHAPEALIQFLRKNSEVGIVGPRLANSSGVLDPVYSGLPTMFNVFSKMTFLEQLPRFFGLLWHFLVRGKPSRKPRKVDYISGACMVFRDQVLKQVGLLDENFVLYFEDIDWCHRAFKAGWKIYLDPEVEVIHYEGQSARQNVERIVLLSYESMYNFFAKQYSPGKLILLRFSIVLGSILRLPIWSLAFLLLKRKRAEAAQRIRAYWKVMRMPSPLQDK